MAKIIVDTTKTAISLDALYWLVEQGNSTFIDNNATNGDVIKALFPNSQEINHHSYVEFDIKDCEESQRYDCGWWNAPYKA